MFGTAHQYVVLSTYSRTHRTVLRLYVHKNIIVPHAQVGLHPYDTLLWIEDQEIPDPKRPPHRWRNTKRNEDGGYYKVGIKV
ncbi:hypothetical protein AAVH_07337 [Aphelenchoides avenae]|nr:hypothetical protein AAVH_07337 [Aphelenchus avenae]